MSSLSAAAAACVLLALTFSGCLWFGGHCGPFYDDATWSEPGLYQALTEKGTEVETPDGLPFSHDDANQAWGDDLRVRQVSWANESAHHGDDHATRVSLSAAGESSRGAAVSGPHISMSADARVPNETWAAMLVTFLEATGTTPADRDAWIAGFLAGRTVMGYSYGADRVERPILSSAREIERAPDLDGLAVALGTPERSAGATSRAGLTWETENGTWSYHLGLPVRTFDAGELRDETVTVRVDTAGSVTADVPQAIGDHPDDYRDWLATRFQEEGLPRPTFTGFELAASIC